MNDILINYDYQGQMICELQIKIVYKQEDGFLYQANRLVYDMA